MTVPPPLDPRFYDAELRRHDVHLRAAAGIGPGDHVLDVGCGGGQTTRDAARAAGNGGSATGVDLAPPMLDHARRVAGAEGVRNVTDEPVFYGDTADAALEVLLRLRHVDDLLTDPDPVAAAAAHDRLRAMAARHRTDDGVVFASAAWLVTAHRRAAG